MEHVVEGVRVTCDTCNAVLTQDDGAGIGVSIFNDGEDALEFCLSEDWWCDGWGHHYCSKHAKRAQREAKTLGLD